MRSTMGTLKDINQECLSCTRERTHDWWLTKVDLVDDEYTQPQEASNQGQQDAG